jgi:hypothetical protein
VSAASVTGVEDADGRRGRALWAGGVGFGFAGPAARVGGFAVRRAGGYHADLLISGGLGGAVLRVLRYPCALRCAGISRAAPATLDPGSLRELRAACAAQC